MSRIILDVSSNNGRVNFGHLRAVDPSLTGVIAKATEGSGYVNPLFGQQIADARAAGLAVGAYSFMHPSVAGTGDDSLFERVAGLGALPLGMWLDCEVTDGLDPATILARFLEDAAEFDRHYAGHDGIYTGRWFWDPYTRGSVPAHVERWPLWVSGYVNAFSSALLPVPWTSCKLWQFTDNWHGTGIDASAWMGTDTEWDAWVGGAGWPPTPGPSGLDAHRFDGWPVLRVGSKDSQTGPMQVGYDPKLPVHSWQNALNIALGHESDQDPARLSVDGVYGPATAATTARLQGAFHLATDGVVGIRTYTLAAFLLTAAHR